MTSEAMIAPEHVLEITGAVWDTVLQLPLSSTTAAGTGGAHEAHAAVHISGTWNGSVALSCSRTLVRRAAGAMFQAAPEELDEAEVRDAFGELANMVGGQVKSLLPEPCQLSLPAVSYGEAHAFAVPGAVVVTQVGLDCLDEGLDVTVWQRG
ncbi:MAG: chemotaxis protein CheX [Nocardioidaceae bacterium]|nr:chemotaxis protein CheX [Nocardioidaceae bacterium]